MPAGLLTRFMIKVSRMIEGDSFWKGGVVLHYEKTRAYVIEDEADRIVRIEVAGSQKKELLAIIRNPLFWICTLILNEKSNLKN